MILSGHYLRYWTGTVSGQVGNPGAQRGTGLVAVADWWLGNKEEDAWDAEAAATPTNTTESAKMRTASFITGNLFCFECAQGALSSPATE